MIPNEPMRINLTFLEVVFLLIISCSLYIRVKYGKKIIRWWKDLHRKRRAAGQLKPRSPEACPKLPAVIIACHVDHDEMSFPGKTSKALPDERNASTPRVTRA
jgi:hypothetical protein